MRTWHPSTLVVAGLTLVLAATSPAPPATARRRS